MRHLGEKIWKSDEVMAVNAELGLTMEQLIRLGEALLDAIAPHPEASTPPAAPQLPKAEGSV